MGADPVVAPKTQRPPRREWWQVGYREPKPPKRRRLGVARFSLEEALANVARLQAGQNPKPRRPRAMLRPARHKEKPRCLGQRGRWDVSGLRSTQFLVAHPN
jgi:hypothetical protein